MRFLSINIDFIKKFKTMFDKNEKAEEKRQTIQDIAVKLSEEQQRLSQLETTEMPKERTIFVLGSKGVGKSTAINKFFEREECTRPTLALEYSFGRRTGSGGSPHGQKQVLNLWELGSLDNATKQLIEVPMRTHGLRNLSVIIMLDLSQPQRVWSDLECAYKHLKDTTANMLQTHSERQIYQDRAVARVKSTHTDLPTLELLPMPVVIVGGKYDIFMDYDSELKKSICRCLRAMTHLIGGSLLFYSHKIPKLAKVLRDTISHLGFGSPTNPFRTLTTDYNDALSIWFGSDSWARIGEEHALSVERIAATLSVDIPQMQSEKMHEKKLIDPAKDPGFKESIIDDLRTQRDEELASTIRDLELRGKFESVSG